MGCCPLLACPLQVHEVRERHPNCRIYLACTKSDLVRRKQEGGGQRPGSAASTECSAGSPASSAHEPPPLHVPLPLPLPLAQQEQQEHSQQQEQQEPQRREAAVGEVPLAREPAGPAGAAAAASGPGPRPAGSVAGSQRSQRSLLAGAVSPTRCCPGGSSALGSSCSALSTPSPDLLAGVPGEGWERRQGSPGSPAAGRAGAAGVHSPRGAHDAHRPLSRGTSWEGSEAARERPDSRGSQRSASASVRHLHFEEPPRPSRRPASAADEAPGGAPARPLRPTVPDEEVEAFADSIGARVFATSARTGELLGHAGRQASGMSRA